ncbi:DUF1573 domain-containing protein [Pirellulaceae bacterium]|nr:DUF1573 domain-containing protein [Pirellulaceae bacterium]
MHFLSKYSVPWHSRLWMLATVIACSLTSAGQVISEDWTRKCIANRSHDFGTVARGAKVVHFFELKNPTDRPIHIASVRSSCGCTFASIVDPVIPVGGTGKIAAELKTRSFLGKKEATITVSLDQPQFAEIQLRVSAYIRRDIVFSPGELRFANVPAGKTQSITTLIHYAGSPNWKIVDVCSFSKFLTADLIEIERTGSSVKYQLTTTLKETAPPGVSQGQVIIKTNDLKASSIPLSFFTEVVSPIRVSPTIVRFQAENKSEEVQKKRIFFSAKNDFRIVGAVCSDTRVNVEISPKSKKNHRVLVSFQGNGSSSLRSSPNNDPTGIPIQFRTDLEGGKTVDINIQFD